MCLVVLLPAPHFEPYNQTAGFSPIEDAPLKPSISFKNMVVISCEKCVLDIDWIEVSVASKRQNSCMNFLPRLMAQVVSEFYCHSM